MHKRQRRDTSPIPAPYRAGARRMFWFWFWFGTAQSVLLLDYAPPWLPLWAGVVAALGVGLLVGWGVYQLIAGVWRAPRTPFGE